MQINLRVKKGEYIVWRKEEGQQENEKRKDQTQTEVANARKRKYYFDHRESIQAKVKAYGKAHPEKVRGYKRKHKKENPDI